MVDLLLIFGHVELLESLVTEVLKLSVGMFKFFLDEFLLHLISSHDFIFLVALMPFSGSSNSSDSLHKVKINTFNDLS